MTDPKIHSRQLKRKLLDILNSPDYEDIRKDILRFPLKLALNPLISFLCATDEQVKMRAVRSLGDVVAEMAKDDIEASRVVMRRLMWSLNDESGGIGWGAPEAMGEIMARHEGIANEYHKILISYIREDGNYIEHEMLQRGVLWGIGRLAEVRPHLVKEAERHLLPYLKSTDSVLRGLAERITASLKLN